jgi:chemotaxis protein MotB
VRRRRISESLGAGGHDGGGSLRWLLTYADMITLLMAFFIMMYSMSILNLNRFRQVAISIRSGFGGMAQGQGKSILGTGEHLSLKKSPIEGDNSGVPWEVVRKIQSIVKAKRLQKSVMLRPDERGLVVSLVTDQVLFAKGDAELSSGSRKLVTSIAGAMKGIPNGICVEGHTCDLPIVSDKYPSNWELSTARATTVIRCLIEQVHISPERLSAAGYADSKPLVPNNCEKNRAINRRVDIVVLKTGSHG